MNRKRISILALTLLTLTIIVGLSLTIYGRENDLTKGCTFTLVILDAENETTQFDGMALRSNMRLSNSDGGIESVTLLNNQGLFLLTPAIKTYKELDNPNPPEINESGWLDWLLEPGRVNPLIFADSIGEDEDIDGKVSLGQNNSFEAEFDEGLLISLKINLPRDNKTIVYTYKDFEEDSSIKQEDFSIPTGFRE